MGRKRRRNSLSPASGSSNKKAKFDNVYLETLDEVYRAVAKWPDVIQDGTTPVDLYSCVEYFSGRLQNTVTIAAHFPSPTLDDYLRLHELRLEVARMTVTLSRTAQEAGMQEDFRKLRSAFIKLERNIGESLFVLPNIRPPILKEYVTMVKSYAQIRIPQIIGTPLLRRPQELERFSIGGRLSDESVNYLVNVWAAVGDPTLLIVETWWATKRLMERNGQVKKKLDQETLDRPDRIFGSQGKNMPADVSKWRRFIVPLFKSQDDHWAALAVDFRKGIICVIDSFPLPFSKSFNERICKNMIKILELWWKKRGATSGPKLRIVEAKVPHQGNGDDCGVHILAWMEALLFHDPFPTSDNDTTSVTFENLKHGAQANVVGYRMHFLAEIHRFLAHNFNGEPSSSA